MVAGFALIAWIAIDAETGLYTFVVNQNGTILQANLGRAKDTILRHMKIEAYESF